MLPKIKLNQKLLEIVKDRNVVIVGPAPYLEGQNRGTEFDKYDVIVRPNEIIPPKHLRVDYGSRTDVFFCNFGDIWMPGIKRKIEKDDHDSYYKNIKLVVGSAIKSNHSQTNFLSWSNNHVSSIPSNFQSINKHNLPFYWIGVEDYKKIYQKIGVEFNTGIAAIVMLLCYPIKTLNIAGFTFYKNGKSYKDLYYEGHMDNLDQKGRSFGFHSGHGYHTNQRQIDYVKSLIMEKNYSEKIKIDKKLREVLS